MRLNEAPDNGSLVHLEIDRRTSGTEL